MKAAGNTRKPQAGVALITAVLIVALATIIAAAMASRVQLDTRRTSNLINGEQSTVFAGGVETWALQVLVRDRKDNQTDSAEDDWAKQLAPISVAGGQVTGRVEDLQARFNLNNLVKNDGKSNPAEIQRLQRLLAALDIPGEVAFAVADWIDRDIDADINGGAEDDVYSRQDIPYRTGNTAMANVSELLLIRDVSREHYLALLPYVTTLPAATPINVNTAPAKVLRSLAADISDTAAEALVKSRDDEPFDSVDEFMQQLTAEAGLSQEAANAIDREGLAVTSGYFLVSAEARFGNGRARIYSIVRRSDDNKVRVLTRTQGVL